MRAGLKARFERKVRKTRKCWLWKASTSQGYGVIGLGSRSKGTEKAHRVSWKLYRGPIPPDKQVLHRCNNRLCVRPSHLYLGTQKQNIDDSFRAGTFPLGSRNGQSKITETDVIEIRRLASLGWTATKLTKKYPLDRMTISRCIRRETWRHV